MPSITDLPIAFNSRRPTPPPSPATTIDSGDFEPDVDDMAERFVAAVEKVVTAKLSEISSSGDGKKTNEDTTHLKRASTLAYKRVEEAWDVKTGKYKIVEAKASEGGDLDQYVFIVRKRIDKITNDTTTFIDVKSEELREILRAACHDFRGVSLANNSPSIGESLLYHAWPILKIHQAEATAAADKTIQAHLGLLLDYLEETFRSTDEDLQTLLANNEITYDLLWALFEPNSEVYTICEGTGSPRCVLYSYCEEGQKMDGSKYLRLETRFLGTDGKLLGEASSSSQIPRFPGARRIDFLPAYPLKYHPDFEELSRKLIHSGRRFVSLIGIHHCQYDGKAFYVDDEDEIVRRYVQGRIMVDSVCFQEQNPFHPQPDVRKVSPRQSMDLQSGWTGLSGNPDSTNLEDRDFLICSPTVLGFCLTTKTFLEFSVANTTAITWSPSSYDDIKMSDNQKKPIWALTETYLTRDHSAGFTDLVHGKGQGINFLLYGPPGVGKTLTAETIAETHKRPLYTVPAGQIGVDPVKVETILTRIFKVASRWKAILLLDEADVFLAQRSGDPHINALVSVFLRELERFGGILFLTTNRVQSFDEAMVSRIHVAIEYKPLGKDARKAVWKYFLEQARTKSGSPDCAKLVDALAGLELNGREIRNTVFVAQSMAEYEGTVVGEAHLKGCMIAREQFRRDYHGAGATDNLSSYI